MKEVRIEDVSTNNWYECCMLTPFEDQKDFVDSNSISLAQSKFEPSLKALAIYYDNKLVGFAMYNTEKEDLDAYWIYRLMIDKEYQGLGIGKKALSLIISEMKRTLNCNKIVLGYTENNYRAETLYRNMGFKHEGHFFGKEKAVTLEI